MNQISILRFFRKLYSKSIGTYQFPPLPCERNIDKASDVIYNLLDTGKPCMIARFGATRTVHNRELFRSSIFKS